MLFHDKDRVFVDSVLGVSDEVTQLWRVDLFILSRNKEASDAEQLHVVLLRLLVGEVAVQQIDCDEERLWQQPKAGVSVHQPLNDVCADVLIELGLPFHVEEIGLGLVFGLLHVLSDAVDVLGHGVYVPVESPGAVRCLLLTDLDLGLSILLLLRRCRHRYLVRSGEVLDHRESVPRPLELASQRADVVLLFQLLHLDRIQRPLKLVLVEAALSRLLLGEDVVGRWRQNTWVHLHVVKSVVGRLHLGVSSGLRPCVGGLHKRRLLDVRTDNRRVAFEVLVDHVVRVGESVRLS